MHHHVTLIPGSLHAHRYLREKDCSKRFFFIITTKMYSFSIHNFCLRNFFDRGHRWGDKGLRKIVGPRRTHHWRWVKKWIIRNQFTFNIKSTTITNTLPVLPSYQKICTNLANMKTIILHSAYLHKRIYDRHTHVYDKFANFNLNVFNVKLFLD